MKSGNVLFFASRGAEDINKIVFHRSVSCVIEDLNGKEQFLYLLLIVVSLFSRRCVGI